MPMGELFTDAIRPDVKILGERTNVTLGQCAAAIIAPFTYRTSADTARDTPESSSSENAIRRKVRTERGGGQRFAVNVMADTTGAAMSAHHRV